MISAVWQDVDSSAPGYGTLPRPKAVAIAPAIPAHKQNPTMLAYAGNGKLEVNHYGVL